MRARLGPLALVSAFAATAVAAQQPELIDRTLAIVGGQAITLSDARAALTFGLVDVEGAPDPEPAAAARLIDRELILREVRRYSPPAPPEAEIEAVLGEVRTRFATPQALARALEAAGLTDTRLRAWVRDDLRMRAYLEQRFAAASTPTDADISRAYAEQRAVLELAGTSFEDAAPMLREQVAASRRADLIAGWVADLRRRTDVIVLPQ